MLLDDNRKGRSGLDKSLLRTSRWGRRDGFRGVGSTFATDHIDGAEGGPLKSL
jgi:hypothetical protein